MKHFLILSIAFLFSTLIYGQREGQNCDFSSPTFVKEIEGGTAGFTPVRNPPPNPRRVLFDGDRIIYWCYGLGGNVGSWARAAEATAYQAPGQQVPGYPARKADCINPAYSEFSLSGAGYNLHTKLVSQGDPLCLANNITDKTINFIIAHSQGGLVSRACDKYYADQGAEGERRFGGIATFGSPHNGAQILNNSNLHAPFINEGCQSIAAGPTKAGVYGVTKIPFFGYGIYKKLSEIGDVVCNILTTAILPSMLEGQQQPITSDYKVGAPALNDLNGYTSSLPRVAFYGIEDNPEFWREMFSFQVKTPNEFPPFQADEDDVLVNQASDMRNHYYSEYQSWSQRGDWHWAHWRHGKARACYDIAAGYLKGYNWLTNANEKFLAVIGALQQVTQTVPLPMECQCATYDYDGNVTNSWTYPISDPSECTSSGSMFEGCNVIGGGTQVITTTVVKPNDGAVLAESASAFSGAVTDVMPGSNHQEMRNDSNTKAKLNGLFNGVYGDYFVTPPQ